MSDKIDAIIKTRKQAAEIFTQALLNIDNISEIELRDLILSKMSANNNLFPKGWYDPPPGGVGILFDEAPFKRLQFESLRDSSSWPNEISRFKKESVAIIYLSPVDRTTGMLGDFGCTVYKGDNQEIKEHILKCFKTTLAIAEHAEVGMKFYDLYKFANNLFKNELKIIGWMTTTNDPTLGINLGHTIPGSLENYSNLGNSFSEIKDFIRTKRKYINSAENFEIPTTCAFTVETRLADLNNPRLPNVFFHFIVIFRDGEKHILKNFENIFKIANMNYI